MEVEFAFLCDYADNSGKMTAVGIGIDTIYARELPARHPVLFSVISIKFSAVEVGEKRVGVRIIDSDGNPVTPPLDLTIQVSPAPRGYLYRTHRIVMALHGLGFARYGDYSVHWLVDGHEVKDVSLKIAQPQIGSSGS